MEKTKLKHKIEAKYVAGVILVVIIVGVLAYYNNMLVGVGLPAPGVQYKVFQCPIDGLTFATQELLNQHSSLVHGGAQPGVVGTFTMKDTAYNALDITSALTLGTNVDQSFYGFRNGGWVLLGGHGASGTDIELIPQDGGYIYILCQRHSTQAYIFAAAQSLAMNPRAVQCQFLDVTGDSIKEFIVKWNMANIPPAASGYPSCTFNGYYFADDSGSASIPSGGQPADITGVTGAATTKFLAWYLSLSAEKKALAVYKIELKVNSTDASKSEVVNINIPGVGLISGSSMSYQKTDSYQIWTWTIGENLGNSVYWQVPANTLNKFDLTASVKHTLASGDIMNWTLTVYELAAGQTTTTDTDSVLVTYA